MSVDIHICQTLQRFTNNQTIVTVRGGTVGECLDELVNRYPVLESQLFTRKGTLLHYVDIYVNRESSYPEELRKPVRDGDELSMILMVAGG